MLIQCYSLHAFLIFTIATTASLVEKNNCPKIPKSKTSCAKSDTAITRMICWFQFQFVNCPQNPVALCSDCNNAQQSGSPPSGANLRVFPLSPSLRTIETNK